MTTLPEFQTPKITAEDVGSHLAGFRMRHRDPRTLYLISQRVL